MVMKTPALSYKLAVSTATSARATGGSRQAEMRALTTDIIVRFGDSTVSASATEDGTTKLYGSGTCLPLVAGAPPIAYELRDGVTHFSAIAYDGSTSGTLLISFSEGED